MGFRLPLDSLPYLPEAKLDQVPERNPFEPVATLRSPTDEVTRPRSPCPTTCTRISCAPPSALRRARAGSTASCPR